MTRTRRGPGRRSYKIISKTLALKPKKVMAEVVHPDHVTMYRMSDRFFKNMTLIQHVLDGSSFWVLLMVSLPVEDICHFVSTLTL